MPKEGFQNYNRFKKNLKELKQLYDLTSHLYIQEHERIETLLPSAKKVETITTRVGVIDHGLNSLYELTDSKYPDKLRQLILISSITTLEVFLTDMTEEVFHRNPSVFEEQSPIEFMKGKVLNTASISD